MAGDPGDPGDPAGRCGGAETLWVPPTGDVRHPLPWNHRPGASPTDSTHLLHWFDNPLPMTSANSGSPWSVSTPPVSTPPADGSWLASTALVDPATRLVRDEEEYLDNENHDVGRRLSEAEHELFVSCDPAPALQQQFEHLRPEYIALHDIGTPLSRKLLAGVAAASQRKLQKLTIRRQSHGTPLASLEFLELNAADGRIVRLYTTETDADAVSRRLLSRTLLCFSRLAVVMVGDLPPHAVDQALRPLQDEISIPPWHNRHVLILPLAAAAPLATRGAELARRTGVQVLTTPLVSRPSEAWQFIVNTFGRLKTDGTLTPNRRQADLFGGTATAAPTGPQPMPPVPPRRAAPASVAPPITAPVPAPVAAPVPAASAAAPVPTRIAPPPPSRSPTGMEETIPAAFPMHHAPQVSNLAPLADTPPAATGLEPLQRYLERVSQITGMVSCCLFEVATGRDLLHAGSRPAGDALGRHGSALVTGLLDASRGLGLGHSPPDAAITLGAHHLVLRPVPRHPGVALHAVLDKHHANLVLARLQLLRIDATLEEG
jgi:hypothetical protein